MSYATVIHWQDGRTTTVLPRTYDATNPRLRSGVAHDPCVIRRIEIHDLDGCLETIFSAIDDQFPEPL